jgi:hypothetical protein
VLYRVFVKTGLGVAILKDNAALEFKEERIHKKENVDLYDCGIWDTMDLVLDLPFADAVYLSAHMTVFPVWD